jgi:hypothetical protein|nr:MAG TPA: hypothetical protein [Caudoviricetes sp.]
MSIDIERIINGTPDKRIVNAYNTLKNDYTEENAGRYKEVYSNESISSILDNAEIIFSEPFYGTDFFINLAKANDCIWFSRFEEIYEKISSFYDNYATRMNEVQKERLANLQDIMHEKVITSMNVINYAYYIRDNIGDIEFRLLDYISHENINAIEDTIMDNLDNVIVLFTYLPYVANVFHPETLDKIAEHLLVACDINSDFDNEMWSTYIECVIMANKLSKDKNWLETFHTNINNRSLRQLLREFINTDLNEVISNMNIKRVKSVPHHVSIESAIDDQLLNMEFGDMNFEENSITKKGFEDYTRIAFEKTSEHIGIEYSYTNNTESTIEGYSLFREACSLDDAYTAISAFVEAEETNFEVDNKDNRDYLASTAKSPKTKESNSGSSRDYVATNSKAPKAKNVANSIQYKAMDAEAKQMALFGKVARTGQDVVNAGKAVMALPMNVVKEIKKVSDDLDKADDNRRKAFMTDPGFRKKSFHNLKMAIMYGTAVQINLALLPILLIIRHFSKDKDIRIRNELIREIETEIKVCEEKITDASSAGDNKEKYRLIRIKEKLLAELARVKSNSKYV